MAAVERIEPDDSLLRDAVERVWQTVASKQAGTVSEAVSQLWPLGLDDDALQAAARVGIIRLAHDWQGDSRKAGRSPMGWGAPHGKQWAAYLVTLSQPFMDADGHEKPLLDFDIADLAAFEARCRAVAKGWLNQGKIAKQTRELLIRHGVDRVRELPELAQREIASGWQEAWT